MAWSKTDAVKRRIECHTKYAKKELNDWIFEIVRPQKGEVVLDLGCGTGKQLIPLSKATFPKGKVIGVDISDETLNEVAKRASNLGHGHHISLIKADMDEFFDDVDKLYPPVIPRSYTLILSSYAIYYSKDMVSLIQKLHEHLSRGGRIFICGQDNGNNDELIHLLNSIGDVSFPKMKAFISVSELTDALKPYSKNSVHFLQNPVEFPNVDSVMEYWRNHPLYRKELEQSFRSSLEEHFSKNKQFVVTKRVLGVLAYA